MNIISNNKSQSPKVLTFLALAILSSKVGNYKTVLLTAIDSLYWGLHWLDDVEKYNADMGYTEGNWVPVNNQLEQHQIKLNGTLPAEVVGGMFVRMGTNAKCWPPVSAHHAFNGEAMMHRILLRDQSTLEYSNSYVEEYQSGLFNNESCTGESCLVPSFSFGDINKGGLALLRLLLIKLRNRITGESMPSQERQQPGSTSLITHANRTFTASEVVMPFEVSLARQGVSPIGFTDLDGLLSNQEHGPMEGTMSAHPKEDPVSGELFFFSTSHGSGSVPFVNYGVLNANGSPQKYLQIPVPTPQAAFYHDMFLTENYAIFFHSSLKKDTKRLAKGESFTFFDEKSPLSFGILPRNATSASEVIWIDAPNPGHIWHTVGAREDGDCLTLYAPKFSNYSDEIRIHLPSEEPSYLTKFEIDLTKKECTETIIFDEVVERPSFNPNVLSPTYVYLRSEGRKSSEMGKTIIKYNLAIEKAEGEVDCGQDCNFGEALFVPRPGGESEDDGYLMDIPYYPETHTSKFLMWNAKSLSSGVVASADLPQRVPYGAHGKWLDDTFFH